MAQQHGERMASPCLDIETFRAFKAQCDRLGYTGPVLLATDCTKVSARLPSWSRKTELAIIQVSGAVGWNTIYSGRDEEGRRVGGHVVGSSMPWNLCYAESSDKINGILDHIKALNRGSQLMRCTYLRVSVSRRVSE
jgi:hypothetical protein